MRCISKLSPSFHGDTTTIMKHMVISDNNNQHYQQTSDNMHMIPMFYSISNKHYQVDAEPTKPPSMHRLVSAIPCGRPVFSMLEDAKMALSCGTANVGKPWDHHGKTMGKRGKTMGKHGFLCFYYSTCGFKEYSHKYFTNKTGDLLVS